MDEVAGAAERRTPGTGVRGRVRLLPVPVRERLRRAGAADRRPRHPERAAVRAARLPGHVDDAGRPGGVRLAAPRAGAGRDGHEALRPRSQLGAGALRRGRAGRPGRAPVRRRDRVPLLRRDARPAADHAQRPPRQGDPFHRVRERRLGHRLGGQPRVGRRQPPRRVDPQLGADDAEVEHRPRPGLRAAHRRLHELRRDRHDRPGQRRGHLQPRLLLDRAREQVRATRCRAHRVLDAAAGRPAHGRLPQPGWLEGADRGERERERPAVHGPLGRAVVPVHAAARVDRDAHLERRAGRTGRT